MIGEVTRQMLPHLSGVPHLYVNKPSTCEHMLKIYTSANIALRSVLNGLYGENKLSKKNLIIKACRVAKN